MLTKCEDGLWRFVNILGDGWSAYSSEVGPYPEDYSGPYTDEQCEQRRADWLAAHPEHARES